MMRHVATELAARLMDRRAAHPDLSGRAPGRAAAVTRQEMVALFPDLLRHPSERHSFAPARPRRHLAS